MCLRFEETSAAQVDEIGKAEKVCLRGVRRRALKLMSKKESAAQNQRKEKTQVRAMDVAVRENGLL